MTKSNEGVIRVDSEKKDEKSISDDYEIFFKVLEDHQGEKHVIVLQNYPDPDAIASSCAHRLISAGFNIETDIITVGKLAISRTSLW